VVFLPEEVSVALMVCRKPLQAFHATPAAQPLKAVMINLQSHDIAQFKSKSLPEFYGLLLVCGSKKGVALKMFREEQEKIVYSSHSIQCKLQALVSLSKSK